MGLPSRSTTSAASFAGGLELGIARGPDRGTATVEEVRYRKKVDVTAELRSDSITVQPEASIATVAAGPNRAGAGPVVAPKRMCQHRRMTEAELYRAVLADPASNEPRLAYAAGIEHKDPDRARFIRLQVADAERLDKPAPSVSSAIYSMDVSRAPAVRKDMQDFLDRAQRQSTEIAERVRAIDALLERNMKRWTSQLPAAVTEARFIRGFLDLVEIPAAAFLAFADELFAAAPIRHVSFTGAHGWMDRLAISPALSRLVTVSFYKNRLDDDDVATLAASPHLGSLRWLMLARNQITMRGLETIASSPLRDLDYIAVEFNPCEDPVDSPAWDPLVPSLMSDIASTQVGEDLERRFGPQHWLHSPDRHRWFFPAPREIYY